MLFRSIKLQLEKDTLEYGKTIGFKVEGVYGHYILKYDPKIIKVNVKTSQISLKADKNVADKCVERAMLKVTCKEDTSKYDIKYIYLKKCKKGIDRLEQQIRSDKRISEDNIINGLNKKRGLNPPVDIQGEITDGDLNKSSGNVSGKPEIIG